MQSIVLLTSNMCIFIVQFEGSGAIAVLFHRKKFFNLRNINKAFLYRNYF